jgi:cell division protein FtsN
MPSPRQDLNAPERPLAFDARQAPRRRSPAPVTLLLSLTVLGVLGGGVFYLYRGGVRAPSGPPAPVGTPIRDIRVAAPPQAETPDPAAGLTIYKSDPNALAAAPKFAPPPEAPAPLPPAPAGPPPPTQEVIIAPSAGPIAAQPTTAARPLPVVAAKVAVKAKPAKTASIETILADSTAAPAKTAKPTAAKSADPTYAVQIGAFSSQALAEKSWSSAAGIAPGEMAGKGRHVAPLTRNGATLYRVAITGFGSKASAEAMCAKLTAAGRSCFVR